MNFWKCSLTMKRDMINPKFNLDAENADFRL